MCKSKTKTLKHINYIVKLIVSKEGGKKYICFKVLSCMLNAIMPIVYTVVPGMIINELLKQKRTELIILLVLLLVATPIVLQAINAIIDSSLIKLKFKLDVCLTKEFYIHSSSMDYSFLEKPDIQTLKGRALETLSGALNIIDQLGSLLSATISLLIISSLLFKLSPSIIVIILFVILLNSLASRWLNDQLFEAGKDLSIYGRKEWGLIYMLDNFSYAKEIRLFGLKNLLIDKLIANYSEANKRHYKNHMNRTKVSIFHTATNFIQQGFVYAFLIYKVLFQAMPVGDMSIVLSATTQFSASLSSIMKKYIDLNDSALKISELQAFLNIPLNQVQTGKLKPLYDNDSVIEFKNVSFKYPGSDRYVLKNINLTICSKEKLCIVGTNGAGKSTFIKLLTRLYYPTEGEILLNGININRYASEDYWNLFAPVFQDFERYYMTFGENIILANTYDEDRLNKICFESGLMSLINKLPKRYNTQVDKWIDEEGFEPSGGEEQRMAVARAVYHGGDIFLLDEPTSALDPLSEYEIYTQFSNMITDKTAILITHRLSAVQLADKVAVFDDGKLVELGTHTELYNLGGIYYDMFEKQSEFYRDAK